MSLTLILMFGVFIIPILLGIFLLRKSRKIAMILLSVPFIFIIGVVSWWLYEANYRFVSDADLAGEQIGEYAIHDEKTDEILEKFGKYDVQDNINYNELFVFKDIKIGTSIHDEIIYIETLTDDLTTDKGIKIGDPLEKVIDIYGENYFRRSDMGLGESVNYVDRDEKLNIQFWLENDVVIRISLQSI